MGAFDVAGVVLVVVLLIYAPGRVIGTALGMPDVFAAVWLGLGIVSLAGTLLALAGAFSLATLSVVIAVLAAPFAIRGRRRGVAAARRDGRVEAIACVAAVAVVAWAWPPFETVIVASDSTMYVNAGVHLARTGRLDVADTIVPLVSESIARVVFPSVSLDGSGPFIRLPGGLLMRRLEAGEPATPAFFPLTTVWAGVLAAAGGPSAALLVATFFAALGVAAVVVFAGRTLGAPTAVCAGILLVANYALWWYARFPSSETLALCFLWGGLAFVARVIGDDASPRPRGAATLVEHAGACSFVAGCSLGLAGLARTETFLFVGAAGAAWLAWERRRPPMLPLLAGLTVAGAVAALTFIRLPTHHVAYLVNDALLTFARVAPRIRAASADPRVMAAIVAAPALVLAAGIVGRRSRVGFVRGASRALVPIVLGIVVAIYARLGGRLEPWRHVGWLAAYCTWPVLALATIGAAYAWRRGGAPARFALALGIVAGVVFVLDPRVAPAQPWAIRRFLPIVIPAITVAAAAALGAVATTERRPLRAAAWIATVVLAIFEARSIVPARAHAYFAGSIATVQRLLAPIRPDAIAVLDAKMADIQLQVPLWLMYGRESVMLHDDDPRWKQALPSFVATGRPVYWIANRYGLPPKAPGLEFRILEDALEVSIPLATGPADVPPRGVVIRRLPLRVYEVVAAGGTPPV